MANPLTLAEAEAQLTEWLKASKAVAAGQAYTINGRQLTRAHAGEIREMIKFWDRQIDRLSRGGIRVRGVTLV